MDNNNKHSHVSIIKQLTQNKQHFAQLHDIGFINGNVSSYILKYPQLTPHWFKILLLADVIARDVEKQYEWYFWMDTDAIFTNYTYNFRTLLSDNHNLIFSDVNNGVFFIRNCEWSKSFLYAAFDEWPAYYSQKNGAGFDNSAFYQLWILPKWSNLCYSYSAENCTKLASYISLRANEQAWYPGHPILHMANGLMDFKWSAAEHCVQSEHECLEFINNVVCTFFNVTPYLNLQHASHRSYLELATAARMTNLVH